MRGSASPLNMTACGISDRSRRCSCISIRRPGSTSAASAINMRTTSRTRSLPRKCTAGSVWNWATISRLQRRPVGHHGFRFRTGLRRVGRSASHRADRRHRRSQRRGRLVAVPAAATMRVLQNISRPLSGGLEQLRLRERIQSAQELVRHRRDRDRHRNHYADGRESADRLRLEDLHEESRSAARNGARRVPQKSRRAVPRLSTVLKSTYVCPESSRGVRTRRPAPTLPTALAGQFSMRNFTNASVFDDTLPVADGFQEIGTDVPLDQLRDAMEDWFRRKSYLPKNAKLELTLL